MRIRLKVVNFFVVLLVMLLWMFFFVKNVSAKTNVQVFQVEDYEKVLTDYNSQHLTTYKIQDYKTFKRNVVNKISPNELLNSLTVNDVSYGEPIQNVDMNSEYVINAEPNTTVRYYKVLRIDGYSGTFYADIETRFPNEDKRYFVKYIRGGVRKESNGYYFSADAIRCVSCESSKCVVRYIGCWVNGRTGLTDNVLRTLDVPFKPWEVY